jgi:hypothetical protein
MIVYLLPTCHTAVTEDIYSAVTGYHQHTVFITELPLHVETNAFAAAVTVVSYTFTVT